MARHYLFQSHYDKSGKLKPKFRETKNFVGVNSVVDLSGLSDKDLETYIKQTVPKVNRRFKKLSGNKWRLFSEFYNDFKEISGMSETTKSGNFSAKTKRKTRSELLQQARNLFRVNVITESERDVEEEVERNITDIFKEPRFTADTLSKLQENQEVIVQMAQDNWDLIYEILGSDRINSLGQIYGKNSDGFYNAVIQETSDELDVRDEQEKQEILNYWKTPELSGGESWR